METIMTNLASPKLTDDQIESLTEKIGGHDRLLQILSGALAVRLVPNNAGSDPISIDPSLSVPAEPGFEERVARGNYGWRHDDLTEASFPVTPDQFGEWEQKLFHFNRNISSEDAILLIRADGFEPARIGDMLAFGEASPDVQQRHPVVGLGSIAEVDQKRSSPTLWFDGDRRTLDLLWLDGDWHRNYRFLGVRQRP
jgi:hypothetical protein